MNIKNIIKKIILLIIIFSASIFTIWLILSNTYEINQHNIWTSWNRVFVSKDGHNEVTYDSNWKVVSDYTNMWSYNFKHYKNEPFGHFMYDTLPWLMWWNNENDRSNIIQRLTAFLKDFWLGIYYTIISNILILLAIVILIWFYIWIKKFKEKIFNSNYLIFKIITLVTILFSITYYTWFIISKNNNKIAEINNNIELANTYYENNKYLEASELYEKLLEEWTVTPELLNNIFASYVKLWRYNKVLYVIKFMVSNFWASESIIWSHIEKDNLSDKIVSLYKEILKEDYKNPEHLLEVAKLLYQAWDYYYDLDSKKYYLAILTQYMNAYTLLDEAIKIDPNNSEYYYYQWRLKMDIGDSFEDSQKKLEKAIELKKDDFNYYYRLWNALMHQNKYSKAKENFLKWIELNSDYEKLHLNLWNMYFKLWEKEKWYLSYEAWLKVCKEMCADFYYNIGNELLNEKKYIEAKISYEKSLEINPTKKETIQNLEYLKDKVK